MFPPDLNADGKSDHKDAAIFAYAFNEAKKDKEQDEAAQGNTGDGFLVYCPIVLLGILVILINVFGILALFNLDRAFSDTVLLVASVLVWLFMAFEVYLVISLCRSNK